MGKLIVIDKEKVERSEHSELIKTAISLLIKHGVATELSTDESIETVIEKILQPKHMNDIYTWKQVKDAVLKATEQSLIDQMKAKECNKKMKLIKATLNGSLDGLELDNTDDVIEKSTVIEMINDLLKLTI